MEKDRPQWKSARVERVAQLLDETFVLPPEGTEECVLFDEQNNFFIND